MTYKLVKYPYGTIRKYTAFCLTPYTGDRVVKIGGKEFKSSNEGPSSRNARHYLTPEGAKGYLRSTGAQLLNPGWDVLPGTAILRPRGKRG